MNASFLFMALTTLLLLIISGIVLFVQRKKYEGKLIDTGILYLKSLRMLLTHVQQHRGLTNSYLHGNKSVELEIQHMENIAEKEIAEVIVIGDWINQNAKWDSFLDHWSRLSESYKSSNAEYNLKQHNVLIASLLYLIDDLAYAHQLRKLGLVDTTDTDWRYLLSVAEYIGQVRALGMGAVSRGTCPRTLRIQLKHLCAKIEVNINRTWPEATLRDLRNFLAIVEHQVVIENPTMSPADYFMLATGCIDHILLEFDRQIEKIQFQRE
jgi:hypothetical protein